jgi:hypothetical protein
MDINHNGYNDIDAREKSLEYLNKAENIFKINMADNCYNIIYIYLNYCWIYSKAIYLNEKWLDEETNKVEFYLDLAYDLYQRYFGNEKELLRMILITEAHCIRRSNPLKAVDLWKQVIQIKTELYGVNANNDDSYLNIADYSSYKKESLSYWRKYLKSNRKKIRGSNFMYLLKDHCNYARSFYFMRRFYFQGYIYSVIYYTLNYSLGKKYKYITFLPLLALSLIYSPLSCLKFPQTQTNWKRNRWFNI